MLAIVFPNINPVMLSFGPLKIHWYGAAYAISILIINQLTKKLVHDFKIAISNKNLEDFLLWLVVGLVIGARLGHVILYDPMSYLKAPIDILKTYEGGLSFHGGLIGVISATYLFSRKYNIRFWNFIDCWAFGAPIGLFFGRLANFINAELYGKVTNLPWAVIFPQETLPRHPTQFYEAFLEGIVLFLIMWYFTYRKNSLNKAGYNSGMFLSFYAIFRIFVEFFKEPDPHIGYLYEFFNMGQLLSLPLLIFGIYLIVKSSNCNKGNFQRD